MQGDAEEIFKVSSILVDTVKYTQMFKASQGAKMNETNSTDPKFQYLRQCQADLNLSLPVLDKVVGKTLGLHGYNLTEGNCKALEQACQFLNGRITRVLFDNCGISDDEFACILRGVAFLNGFQSIIFKRNSFDTESLKALKPILMKQQPNNLKELKIIDCKIPQWIS